MPHHDLMLRPHLARLLLPTKTTDTEMTIAIIVETCEIGQTITTQILLFHEITLMMVLVNHMFHQVPIILKVDHIHSMNEIHPDTAPINGMVAPVTLLDTCHNILLLLLPLFPLRVYTMVMGPTNHMELIITIMGVRGIHGPTPVRPEGMSNLSKGAIGTRS